MSGETTDKTRVVDWNAWLGDVPPEKAHVACECRWQTRLAYPGCTLRSLCGVYFVPCSLPCAHEASDMCPECVTRFRTPCSPSCQRGRIP